MVVNRTEISFLPLCYSENEESSRYFPVSFDVFPVNYNFFITHLFKENIVSCYSKLAGSFSMIINQNTHIFRNCIQFKSMSDEGQ